jgi:enamine deaminase RidA (YjgF/YER057c/UK114 family)
LEIQHINPETMMKPRGYSHAISISGNHRTIYIGGQNALDEKGTLVGKNSFKEQTAQVLTNIGKILEDAGASFENIVKFNIHILHGENPQDGFQVFQQKWGASQNLPTITVLFVAGLGHPDWLVEIDAIAIVADEAS